MAFDRCLIKDYLLTYLLTYVNDGVVVNELVAWRSGDAFHPINQVNLRRARLVLEWLT